MGVLSETLGRVHGESYQLPEFPLREPLGSLENFYGGELYSAPRSLNPFSFPFSLCNPNTPYITPFITPIIPVVCIFFSIIPI